LTAHAESRLQPHRSIADLMRYDAMNRGFLNGGDGVANRGGFMKTIGRSRTITRPSR
jgi:hypothetical protein